jgi:hypothetical protein
MFGAVGRERRTRGALISSDISATNGTITTGIKATGPDYLLAIKANDRSLRADIRACLAESRPETNGTYSIHDKDNSGIEQCEVTDIAEADYLRG